MQAGEEELWARGFTRALLWVLEQNLSARACYEHIGYAVEGLKKEISLDEFPLVELRYKKKKPSQTVQPTQGTGAADLSRQTGDE